MQLNEKDFISIFPEFLIKVAGINGNIDNSNFYASESHQLDYLITVYSILKLLEN